MLSYKILNLLQEFRNISPMPPKTNVVIGISFTVLLTTLDLGVGGVHYVEDKYCMSTCSSILLNRVAVKQLV